MYNIQPITFPFILKFNLIDKGRSSIINVISLVDGVDVDDDDTDDDIGDDGDGGHLFSITRASRARSYDGNDNNSCSLYIHKYGQ